MPASPSPHNLRIIFMGTPEFAVPSLKILLNSGYDIISVITAPDKPAGRGRKIRFSPVKEFALKNNLYILQPEKLKDTAFIEELKRLQADLQVVVAFRILPEIIWSMPSLGTFNLHASLLPQYRGAAPINRAIMNGETETGLTTFFIDHQVDTGNIIMQEKISIAENDNAGSLHDKMMMRGAILVAETVKIIHSGNLTPVPQNDSSMSHKMLKTAPKIGKNDCRINWQQTGRVILNLIRGLSPYPAAFSFLYQNDKTLTLKVFEADFIPSGKTLPPGTINSDNKKYMNVAVKDGFINIKSLQAEGKNKMNIEQFLSGFRDICNYRLR